MQKRNSQAAVSGLISRVTYCQFRRRRHSRPLQFGHSEEKEKEEPIDPGPNDQRTYVQTSLRIIPGSKPCLFGSQHGNKGYSGYSSFRIVTWTLETSISHVRRARSSEVIAKTIAIYRWRKPSTDTPLHGDIELSLGSQRTSIWWFNLGIFTAVQSEILPR